MKKILVLFLSVFIIACARKTETPEESAISLMKDINQLLERNIAIANKANKKLKQQIRDAYLSDRVKMKKYKEMADTIFSSADSLYKYFLDIENGKRYGAVSKMNTAMNKYRELILQTIPEKQRNYIKADTSQIYSHEKHTLKKFRNEVLNLANDAAKEIYSRIDVSSFKFTVYQAYSIAKSKKVYSGDEYQSDIFIGSPSISSNIKMYVGEYDTITCTPSGKYDSLKIKDGMGIYECAVKTMGEHEYKGMIQLPYSYCIPFKAEYEAVK